MTEHEKIRDLLALAAAGALTRAEEQQVAAHMRSCTACSNELDEWRSLAADLQCLPTPQPSPRLLQTTLARAQAKLAEQGEEAWNRRVMIFIVAFAWILTVASWPFFHVLSRGFLSLFDPHLGQSWIAFAAFTSLVWLAGGSAAVLLALRQRRERRLA